MGINFEIHYDENPSGMYFTGQMVRGRAIINLDESIPIKGIKLRIHGYSDVRWEETSSFNKSAGTTISNTTTYSDEEIYFDNTIECIDTKGLELILEPGIYTYSFECTVPLNCPTSFEGTYGRIHYEAKITIVRPRKFNKSYSMGFNVLNIFDLNYLPDLTIPAKMEIFKSFCCGPCKSRPLVLSLDIPRTGYVPGEFVNVNVRVANGSSINIEHMRIALNLVALYSVRNSIRTYTEKIAIAKSKFGGFEKSTLELKDKIQVPPTPPTCENLCQIIKITYEIEVTAKVKGAHISPVVSIPIIIGNIPYVARSANISEDALLANLRNGIETGSGHQSNFQPELSPPTYQEAIFVQPLHPPVPQKDDENTDTKFEKYVPRYPFYNVPTSTVATQENRF